MKRFFMYAEPALNHYRTTLDKIDSEKYIRLVKKSGFEQASMLKNTVKFASAAINAFVKDATIKDLEIIRLTRCALSLLTAGFHTELQPFKLVLDKVLLSQISDGGWSDPEESAWTTCFLSKVKGSDNIPLYKGIQWLKSNHLNAGGWGKHSRDRARIPTTALVLTLVPEAGSDEDYMWVAQEWAKDLSGSVQLSYKAGFYLLVAGHPSIQGDSVLSDRTIKHLIDDQNEDGGFAPWKNHPIGSDPWSTGVVLWGLSKWIDRVDPAVIDRALHWLEVTQLPSGYWPYHYLDEGTSYALIGAVSAMRAMTSRK